MYSCTLNCTHSIKQMKSKFNLGLERVFQVPTSRPWNVHCPETAHKPNFQVAVVFIISRDVKLFFRCASISWFQFFSKWVRDVFTASASTGLSDFLYFIEILDCWNVYLLADLKFVASSDAQRLFFSSKCVFAYTKWYNKCSTRFVTLPIWVLS